MDATRMARALGVNSAFRGRECPTTWITSRERGYTECLLHTWFEMTVASPENDAVA
jgi:hypothetical protein